VVFKIKEKTMSHTVQINLIIKSLQALKRACENIDIEHIVFKENNVTSFAIQLMSDDLSRCVASIWMGKDGKLAYDTDFKYKIEGFFGPNMRDLIQEYAVEVTKENLPEGYFVEDRFVEQVNGKRQIRLRLEEVGGAR
jgi:hypothetical protein